jgi:HAD superfamily phosphoserine phosphatase-like hydrolase
VTDSPDVRPIRTVSLDVDSTLAGIEGIDWLAARRGAHVTAEITTLTNAAMSGEIRLEEVYARRLNTVTPSRSDVEALGQAYCGSIAPGARECVAAFLGANIRVLIVSGGLRAALLPLARMLRLNDSDVYGVELRFAADGTYAGFDASSPLTQDGGKSRLLRPLVPELPRTILHVGDGMTDAVTRDVVDSFAAYTGFVTRDKVVALSNFNVNSFAALQARVLRNES